MSGGDIAKTTLALTYTVPVALRTICEIFPDGENHIHTVAVRIGKTWSLLYLDILVFGALLLQLIISRQTKIYGGTVAVGIVPQMFVMRRLVRQEKIPLTVDETAAQLSGRVSDWMM